MPAFEVWALDNEPAFLTPTYNRFVDDKWCFRLNRKRFGLGFKRFDTKAAIVRAIDRIVAPGQLPLMLLLDSNLSGTSRDKFGGFEVWAHYMEKVLLLKGDLSLTRAVIYTRDTDVLELQPWLQNSFANPVVLSFGQRGREANLGFDQWAGFSDLLAATLNTYVSENVARTPPDVRAAVARGILSAQTHADLESLFALELVCGCELHQVFPQECARIAKSANDTELRAAFSQRVLSSCLSLRERLADFVEFWINGKSPKARSALDTLPIASGKKPTHWVRSVTDDSGWNDGNIQLACDILNEAKEEWADLLDAYTWLTRCSTTWHLFQQLRAGVFDHEAFCGLVTEARCEFVEGFEKLVIPKVARQVLKVGHHDLFGRVGVLPHDLTIIQQIVADATKGASPGVTRAPGTAVGYKAVQRSNAGVAWGCRLHVVARVGQKSAAWDAAKVAGALSPNASGIGGLGQLGQLVCDRYDGTVAVCTVDYGGAVDDLVVRVPGAEAAMVNVASTKDGYRAIVQEAYPNAQRAVFDVISLRGAR